MTYKIKEQISPNNETRVTLYPVVRKPKSVLDCADEILSASPDEELSVAETHSGKSCPTPLLDIRSEFKTVCSAHSYKRTKFGRNAKTRLMRAGGAMDKVDPRPWAKLFITATLPSDDEWAKWAIAEDSPWIVNCLKAWLSKRCKARLEFYVWEMQERGALHFHWCLLVPEKEARDRIIAEFRLEWLRLLEGVEKRMGVSMWGRFASLSPTAKYCLVQCKVETIRKSVSAYLAGYVGGKKDKHAKDRFIPYYPKRWFGISRHLSSAIAEYSKETTQEYGSYVEAKKAFDEIRRENEDESLTIRHYAHKIGRGETSVNYHTPEKQAELWQSKRAMLIKKHSHPVTWFFVQESRQIALMHSRLMTGSQHYRGLCTKLPVNSLEDVLYQDSMLRGALPWTIAQAIESLFMCLGSQSSLPHTQRQLLGRLSAWCRIRSENQPRIAWSRDGYLVVLEDFTNTVDNPEDFAYVGTSPTSGDAHGGDGIASRGEYPPNGTDSPPIQLSLID